MALTYNIAERDIDIRGTLHLKTGADVMLSAANIVSYTIDERSASSGFSLGEAQSAGFDLVIDDTAHAITPVNVNGASVQIEIGIKSGESYMYSPFGFWYVESSVLSKQSAIATLKGSDALASKFDAVWSDAKGNYPRTLGALATAVCSGTGVTLKSAAFLNSSVSISSLPKWPSGTTRRGVIGYIAACAGGFARIDRSGQLEFVAYNAASVGTVDSNTYRSLETGTGARFDFNCVGVRPVGKDAFTRYAIDTGRADTAASTLQVDENPLCTATIANAIKTALTGFASDGIVLDWVGDPSVQPGDLLTVEDTDETEYLLVVNGQTITFDGGLSAVTRAELATETASSSGYAVHESVLTAKGFLNGRKLSIESVQTDSLAAEAITAEKIAVGTITAESGIIANAAITNAHIADASIDNAKIQNGTIETAKIADAAITNAKIKDGEIDNAKIANATIDGAKIKAATIDEANIKDAAITSAKIHDGAITNAKIENGAINSAKIQDAAITSAKIGSAAIETAKIALGAITAALIATGAIGTAQIADGSITSAKIVSLNADVITAGTLSVERLLLKGANGLFHAINATDDGLTVEQLSQEEYQNRLSGTVLVARSVTAAQIAAETITANEIAAGTITSDKIDVVELFAAEAVIDHLKTYDIRNDGRITLTVGGERKTVLVLQGGEMIFGDPANALKTVQTGERFSVRQGGQDVSYFSGEKLWIRDAEVDNTLRMGNYYVMPASDGGVKFVKA